MKTKKRFLGILLSLAMVLGLLPGMNLTSYADGPNYGVGYVWYVGDPINLGGKYYIANDRLPNDKTQVADVVCKVPYPEYYPLPSFNSKQWRFVDIAQDVEFINSELKSGLLIAAQPQRSTEDNPIGFRLRAGTGTKSDPYRFEAIYVVMLDKTNTTVTQGDVAAITATIHDNQYRKVKWSIGGDYPRVVKLYSDPACTIEVGEEPTETLTVYARGVSVGHATVTATSTIHESRKDVCSVTVKSKGREIGLNQVYMIGDYLYVHGNMSIKADDALFYSHGCVKGTTQVPVPYYDKDSRQWVFDSMFYQSLDILTPLKVGSQTVTSPDIAPVGIKVTGGNGREESPYRFGLVYAPYSVTIAAGNHMTKTADSGKTLQAGFSGAMTPVVYTANEGYYFPEDYSVASANGISVTRDSFTQITVSGTPTADTVIELKDPEQKKKAPAPETAEAVNCTNAENNNGRIIGVTTAMEYMKAGDDSWTDVTGSEITGLVPGYYYVRVKETETTWASDIPVLRIKGIATHTVTFRVENGSWDDGTVAEQTVIVTGPEGDTPNLSANQIPSAGNRPADGYRAGSWDVTPTTDLIITGDTVFTYSYARQDSIDRTVIFRVVNGAWDDAEGSGARADRAVTLTGMPEDKLTLWQDQIPQVGGSPDETFKAGSWDKIPNTADFITEDMTYTYTYAPREKIQATVTFVVEDGSWDDRTVTDKTVTLEGLEGDTLKLTQEQIPAAGSRPGDGRMAGSWDVTPTTDLIISGDTVFTYTYAHRDSITRTVTFRVLNGAWDDAEGSGATADRIVTLTGMPEDKLTLWQDQIPRVGGSPDPVSKAGSWDVTPNTADYITGDVTYTYTYAPRERIQATVTFRVEDGSWNDRTVADQTYVLTGLEGDTLKLRADQIPAAGSRPGDARMPGSWNVTPTTDLIISGDTVFTYTYARLDSVSRTVTFRVVNGAWDDAEGRSARADRTVTLTGMPEDQLRLWQDQIPVAGGSPDETFKAGSWDKIPNTADPITEDITYTYTYAPKEKIQATVTFRVADGAWNDGTVVEQTCVLTGLEGDTLKLKAEQIPAAGSRPGDGRMAGAWDVTPTTDLIISGDTIFTYTYAKQGSVSRTVTFRVVNGAWDDAEGNGARANRTVTLTGMPEDKLTLWQDQIPLVGGSPDEGFMAGFWDVTPNTGTVITGPVTYTYTYAPNKKIQATVTFRVEGGAWDDGTAADKTYTLTGLEGDTLKLQAEQIPAAGSRPAEGYQDGSWDVTPATDRIITGNTIFTYSYLHADSISHTVTFRVVNGAWDDAEGSSARANRTVTLTGMQGDALKLWQDQIPVAGGSPDAGYKAGSWDVTPNAGTAITGPVTYTYTYVPKEKTQAAVTFRVAGGAWNDGTTADKTVVLTGLEEDTLHLSADQIPAAGSQPAEGYQAGAWDVTPTTDLILSGDTVFTYTYARQGSISRTVTFRVVNGAWDDAEGSGARADRLVTLTGTQGDALKLTQNQIPAVGSSPDKAFKAGSWNAAPSIADSITEDITYTYTYAPKKKIQATVTFRVAGGAWNDGTTADKTYTLTGLEGDTLKLSAEQIPAAGSQPEDARTAGSWDVTPTTDLILSGNTTFTYSYLPANGITQTVTFRVENGAWDDAEGRSARASRIVTLTGVEGDTLKLAQNQIPAVGSLPDEGFVAGSWDAVPDTNTAITEPVIYTYTYAPKSSIQATVTFRVTGGNWDDGTAADKTVTLTGLEGETLKLEADQIPAAGSRPADGYEAGSWDVVPSINTAITGSVTYTYAYTTRSETFRYSIVSVTGDPHVTGDGKNAVITVRRSVRDGVTYESFEGVDVDGVSMSPANYATEEGSLVLTMKASYLDTLKEGNHAVRIRFTDGGVETSLQIKAARKPPKTGDTASPFLWLGLMVLGIAGVALSKRAKRQSH